MSTATRISMALVFALVLSSCRTAPIVTPEINVASVNANGKSAAQVADAIKRGGTDRGWTIADAGPGHMTGTLNSHGRNVVVDIPYSKDSLKIVYKSSEGLRYGDGKIHKNYNKWVRNLAEAIKKQLAGS